MKHFSLVLRRCILTVLVLSIGAGITCVASASNTVLTDDGVEIVAPDIMPLSLNPTVKGGRETRNRVGYQTEERVWGWSTLTDAAGGNVYHSTTAQYENILTGSPYGSSTSWGYGKVWAYSGWIWYKDGTGYRAKVYYNY